METADTQKPIRKIIHISVDYFYAAVEMRDDPSLQHSPVVVGGAPNRKGVISSANYEARKTGIHVGMESSRARQLCPALFIILPEMKKYEKESKKIRAILYRFTNLVEPLSLDETYLDVSSSDQFKGDGVLIVSEIQRLIHVELSLTSSAGIASNKFLARVASNWKKPDGRFAITTDIVDDFILKLPVKKIWEVGKGMVQKMSTLGITTCGDLQKLSLKELNFHFESKGNQLYNLCRGIDARPVVPSKEVKLFSLEEAVPGDARILAESKEKEKPDDVKEHTKETTTRIKEDEEAQKKAKACQPIFKTLKNAKVVFIELKGKKYQCELTDYELCKQIAFTVLNPDIYLRMNISEDDQVVLRVITGKGTIAAFETNLLEKRLPKLVLTFPATESVDFVRHSERMFAHMTARIIVKKSENPSIPSDISAMGSVSNVSDTGCSFTTNVELDKYDKVYIAIVLSVKGVKKVFQVKGAIQRVKKVNDQLINYGIECADEDRETMKGIRKVVQSQSGGGA